MKRVIQKVACIIEIGIPKNLVLEYEDDFQFWNRMVNRINEIKALGECEILFWDNIVSRGCPIKDFDYYQYQELFEEVPANETYNIQRFYASCITPEYDVFGIEDIEKGKPGKRKRFLFKDEKNILFLVKITGRDKAEERDFLEIVKPD